VPDVALSSDPDVTDDSRGVPDTHPGADATAVGAWLAERLDDTAWRHSTLRPIGAGRSNLTYRVDSPAGAVVLRRPPVGEVAATAHDMGREQRVISALAETSVPVPRVLATSAGGPPVDAPCFVLVALHGIDPDAVGLGDFGRPEGFLARQVRRWVTQWEKARETGIPVSEETLTELTRLADALGAAVPTTQRHTIVHGDYRIDNCLFDADDPGVIRAVLDWELSTLGDPLADLGLLLVYWRDADEHPAWRAAQYIPSPTQLPGFLGRTELVKAYAAGSGLDLAPLPWYVAFGAFKLAVVLAGILARVRAGMVPASMAAGLEGSVDPLVALGHHVLAEGLA
jgi:aminoglycoside phosphotransferase (APT) family kinase protein